MIKGKNRDRKYDGSQRAQKANESRDEVVNLAVKLLRKQGAKFSLRKLAEAANYSERHLYRIFDGLEGLASALNAKMNELLAVEDIFEGLTLEALPERAASLFRQFNANEALVKAYLEAPVGKLAREVWLKEKISQVKTRLSGADPHGQLNKEIRVILSASFWNLVRSEGQMNPDESVEYVQALCRDLLARAKGKI